MRVWGLSTKQASETHTQQLSHGASGNGQGVAAAIAAECSQLLTGLSEGCVQSICVFLSQHFCFLPPTASLLLTVRSVRTYTTREQGGAQQDLGYWIYATCAVKGSLSSSAHELSATWRPARYTDTETAPNPILCECSS